MNECLLSLLISKARVQYRTSFGHSLCFGTYSTTGALDSPAYHSLLKTFLLFSFDATYLYEYTFILLYNLVFTSLPVIYLGGMSSCLQYIVSVSDCLVAFDQDINARAALAFPQLYLRGIRGLEYTRTKFWLYMFDGLYQSVVVFFVPYFAWALGPALSWNGKTIDSLADFGTTASVAAIVSANLYVGLDTR